MSAELDVQKIKLGPAPEYAVQHVPIDEIYIDEEFNCRGGVSPMDVLDLARDIKDRKLDSPITVQPFTKIPGKKYRVIAGHRRLTAFKVNSRDPDEAVALKHSVIPAFVEVNVDETAARTQNLRENLHRKQLNIAQEAKAIKYYLDLGWNEASTADAIGMSIPWVKVRKALLTLPADIQIQAAAGLLNNTQIAQCAKYKTLEKQYAFVKTIKLKREKGEAINLVPTIKQAKDVMKQRERKGAEIKEMKGLIYDVFGPCLATRCMAWADGTINTAELNTTITEEAQRLGIKYVIPPWLLQGLMGVKTEVEHNIESI